MKENLVKLPKTVKVGPVVYEVSYPHKCVDNHFRGACYLNKGYLKISAESGQTTMADQKIQEVFLHETLHAVNDVYLGGVLGESDIEVLGKAIFQILTDNNIKFYNDSIPKKLKICGFVYNVLFPYKFNDTETADVVHSEPELKIRMMKHENSTVNKLNFIFAMLKAVYAHYFMSDVLEDDSISFALSTGILETFRENEIEKLIKGKK